MTDKLSAMFVFLPEILLHVSRGVRWDSDHVVLLNDDLEALSQELVRGNFLDRTHIGLDFFDASINRVAAWVIGTRNMIKSLLKALLEPIEDPARVRSRRRLHVPARPARRSEDHALRRRVGLLLRDEERAGRERLAREDQAVRKGCTCRREGDGSTSPEPLEPEIYAQLNPCLASGSERTRLPVAAKIALQSAGGTGGNAGSPSPVGGLSLST